MSNERGQSPRERERLGKEAELEREYAELQIEELKLAVAIILEVVAKAEQLKEEEEERLRIAKQIEIEREYAELQIEERQLVAAMESLGASDAEGGEDEGATDIGSDAGIAAAIGGAFLPPPIPNTGGAGEALEPAKPHLQAGVRSVDRNFCSKCGTSVDFNFCPKCGTSDGLLRTAFPQGESRELYNQAVGKTPPTELKLKDVLTALEEELGMDAKGSITKRLEAVEKELL